MNPMLTIAIPTYNRVERLKETLKRVIDEVEGKEVEILVSDNASTDGTEEFMNLIVKKYLNIKYFRRKENGGFDANFLNCFDKAKGKYMILLGDDDVLLPGAVDSILKCIELNPVAIYLNTSNLISRNPIRYSHTTVSSKENIVCNDKNIFLKNMGIYCTFISALVYNLELVRKISNKEKYAKTNIIHSHIMFELLRNEGKYIVNSYNCIAEQGNEAVSYDVYNTWIKNYSELILEHGKKSGFDYDLLKEQLHKDLKNTIYDFVINFRRTCNNQNKWNKEGIWQYIGLFPDLIWRYRVAIYLPRCILRFAYFMRKCVKKCLWFIK